jgi:hypothetical protein
MLELLREDDLPHRFRALKKNATPCNIEWLRPHRHDGYSRTREMAHGTSISDLNRENALFWKKRQARVNKLMDNTFLLSRAVQRINESTAYVKAARSAAERCRRIREQKSFEEEIENAAAIVGLNASAC